MAGTKHKSYGWCKLAFLYVLRYHSIEWLLISKAPSFVDGLFLLSRGLFTV